MHLNEGQLRAYSDGELEAADMQRVSAHLDRCAACRERLAAQHERSRWVDSQFAYLDPDPAHERAPLSPRAARTRLAARLASSEKERESMFTRLFSRQARPAWIALALVALLTATMLFPPARAIANSFLGLFRVQQVSVIQIDADNLPRQLENSAQFQALISDNVVVEGGGDSQPAADLTEASALAGYTPRLPAALDAPDVLNVQPGGSVTFDVDLARAQALLDEIGRGDLQLPAELDGQTVRLEVPTMVSAGYGECAVPGMGYDPHDPDDAGRRPVTGNCMTLVQLPSPQVEAPEGLDVGQLGQIYLQVLGLPADEAASLAAKFDWTSTLVLPMPSGQTTTRDVSVDGVQGTLIQSTRADRQQFALIWVKDGMLYGLSGVEDVDQALAAANSLQ